MDESDLTRFATLFARFLEQMVQRSQPAGTEPIVERVEAFLDADPLGLPVVGEQFRSFEHATVQLAIDRLLLRPDVRHDLVGIAGAGREHHSFTELLEVGQRHRAFWVGAVDYATVPVSVDEERVCVRYGLYLIDDGRRRLAVLLRGGSPAHGMTPLIEVLTRNVEDARAWLDELRVEKAACNVLRGQVLSFEPSEFEPGLGPVRFHHRPQLSREDVVLPDGKLDRIERQVVGVARHRGRLVAEGRHLKRGVLLYGPPGAGKTHTVRYLAGALRDFTVVLLAGPAVGFVTEACALARMLEPSLIVLEDCDLVAEDRAFTPFGNPLLYAIFDEMDGLGSDVDVCFLLTTNRVELLESALAQRPGRVDLAAEIPLPDATGRRRLLEIYGRGVELEPPDVDRLVGRMAGVPASFVKEVTRRATLISAGRDAVQTSASDVEAAVDELLAAQEELTRHLLGAQPAIPGDASASAGGRWFAYPTVAPSWVTSRKPPPRGK